MALNLALEGLRAQGDRPQEVCGVSPLDQQHWQLDCKGILATKKGFCHLQEQ